MSTDAKSVDFSAVSRLSADIDLHAEGKATGFVRVPHSVHRSAYGWIPIPIVRIKNGDGPNVLMQAGNHGDEWEGQIGLGNLIRALRPEDIKGRLVILPSANFPAAMAGQRTSPIDDGNLNRSFPGNPDELSQMHGPYIPGLAAIAGVNEGVYRWRQLSSRSPIGVIGDASAASAEKGERLLAAISADVAEALVNDRLWSEPI